MKPINLAVTSWLFWATLLPLGSNPALHGTEPAALPFYPDKMELLNWMDATGQSHPVHTAADWQRRRAHILAGMQQVMGPLPDTNSKCALDVQVLQSEELPTLIRKKITFQAGPGDTIPAYLLIPKNLSGPAPAMLCLHGTSGPRGRTAGIGADYPRYTLELGERGYVTIAPDYTLLGDNQTDPQALGYASGTMKGIWSHLRAVDLLESLPEVDPQRMGCIGVSLGGHNSLFVAAFDPRLKVVVTSSGFDSFLDYMDGDPTGWCQQRYMPRIETVYHKDPHKLPFDFPEVLAAIAPRALYIHAPQSDSNFKLDSVKRCVAAAQKVYQLLDAEQQMVAVYPPGGHGFPLDARLAAYRFVDRALLKKP
ncbi:MAG: acetylxylan esterase [Planctomycetales bacterium]|nr:acetylxylan esterase [Planctomycetales bacterium]